MDNQITDVKSKLAAATEHFKGELAKIRTGRAHPAMLDGVMVEAYGQQMPLKGVANVTAPEAQLLQITPFDPANLQAIAVAIRDNPSLNLTPTDDGRVVRIQIPPLTEETRQQMVKIVGQKVEETMISARQIRHEAIEKAEASEKSKEITRDDLDRFKKQVDDAMAAQKTEIDSLAKAKEQEVTTL